MADQGVDYEAVLADLMAQREELDRMIAWTQKKLGQPVSVEVAGTGNSVTIKKPESSEITSDTFFSMTVSDGIKKFLRMSKRPKGVNEITEALQRGGMQTLSKNFYSSVYSALAREQDQDGGFVKVSKKEWGLAEWYPGRAKG